jgi:hypothetical protein
VMERKKPNATEDDKIRNICMHSSNLTKKMLSMIWRRPYGFGDNDDTKVRQWLHGYQLM